MLTFASERVALAMLWAVGSPWSAGRRHRATGGLGLAVIDHRQIRASAAMLDLIAVAVGLDELERSLGVIAVAIAAFGLGALEAPLG